MNLPSIIRVASTVQLGIGGCAAYLLLLRERPDAVALLLSATIIVTGLAGYMDLREEPRHRRRTTIRLNAVLTVLLLTGAALMVAIERQQGFDAMRQLTLVGLALGLAAPFVTNAIALACIERRHRPGDGTTPVPVPVSRSSARTRP